MSDPPLTMLVNLEIKPDRLIDFMTAINHNAQGSRQEPQCLRFDLLRNAKDPCKFTLLEAYTSFQAHARHRTTAHFKVWNDFRESGGVESMEAVNY